MPEAESEAETPIRVAIALVGLNSRYLIRRRPPGSIMAGVWEFPGGKCEPGETPQECVVRETEEETGLIVEIVEACGSVRHHYPHGFVELHYFECRTVDPDAEPPDDSGFLWVEARTLGEYHFPRANEAIIEHLIRRHA